MAVAVPAGLAGKAEVVHVTVRPAKTIFKEDVKERVFKQKPVILEDVQVRLVTGILYYIAYGCGEKMNKADEKKKTDLSQNVNLSKTYKKRPNLSYQVQ